MRSINVPDSIPEAIQKGLWDFEPQELDSDQFDRTVALPGSHEKLDILARRLAQGLPLWHPEDRVTYDDSEQA